MLIFYEAGLVLLAVPKTGTQALETALSPHADIVFRNPPKLKHMRLSWAQKALPRLIGREEWPRFRTVAIVREPLDWLGSWYRYRRRDPLMGRPVSTRKVSFAEFLEAHISDNPPEFADVGSQARFVRSRDNASRVDFLFAYEQMHEVVAYFQETLARPIHLERRNVSPMASLEVPAELEARVRKHLHADFALHSSLLEVALPDPVASSR